jgi:hypothetical protein
MDEALVLVILLASFAVQTILDASKQEKGAVN